MSADLTVLYYTANRIAAAFASAAMRVNVPASGDAPWILCAQRPLDDVEAEALPTRSTEIIVGDIGASIYNVYRQILQAARYASTEFVACVEDDCLYTAEHFAHRPAGDVFAYNRNRWVLCKDGTYYWRERTQMAQCICRRALLIETLEERFARYPTEVSHEVAKRTGWGEPGRYEGNLGLPQRSRVYFDTEAPNVTFNNGGLMGVRRVNPTDRITRDLAPWGDGLTLWRRIHG